MSIVTSLSNVANMQAAFPALSSRTSATSAQLYHHLEGAAFEVIAKLSKRYDVPYTQTSNELHLQVAHITTRLALQGFLEERAYMQDRTNESDWPAEFDKAREMLDQIAEGAIPLVNNDGSIINGKTGEVVVWSSTQNYLPTFTEDDVLNHVDDDDKIDDLRLERLP